MNKKLLKRILWASYVEFVLILLFWITVGLRFIKIEQTVVYAAMALLTICGSVVVISAVMLDRFYFRNIQESLDNLEKLNMKLRSQRHEYLNEMQVVYGLLEIGEYEEAVNYLKPVYTDIAKVNKALKTAKPAVNALLQSKLEVAGSKGIEFFIEVSSTLENIKVEQWDLCKILGNIIDNAITALIADKAHETPEVAQVSGEGASPANVKNKQIHVQISENQNSYVFVIYNNGPKIPADKINLIFKRGYTSKNEEGHGLGLSIVKDIVTDNKGTINVSSTYTKTAFEINIPK